MSQVGSTLPSVEAMLSMTFYEILGTESHVSQATIGRKRKKISDLCAVTYGKDSDRFHVISIIGSILGNRKSRKLYDEEGHTPFDHLFAPTTPTPAANAQPSSARVSPTLTGSGLSSSSGTAPSVEPALPGVSSLGDGSAWTGGASAHPGADARPTPDPKVPTLDLLMTMGYYDILGVDPSAPLETIRRHFGILAKVTHPDKGGDPVVFRILRHVYEVLSDPEARRKYDQHGRAAFEEDFPRPSHTSVPSPMDVDADEDYTEYVNLRMAKKILELKAIRRLPLGSSTTWTFADAMDHVIRRSTRACEPGLSWAATISARWHESPRSREMGLKGRRQPGTSDSFSLGQVGIFAIGARLIRYIFRSEFGDRMQDLDKSKAYWRYLFVLLDHKLHVVDDFPAVKFFVSNIDAILEHELDCDDDSKKKLLMRIMFQGTLPPGLPDVFMELDREMRRFYEMVRQTFPEKIAIAKGWKKSRPEITVGSYLLMDVERCDLDKVCAAGGSCIMSPEADGVVVFGATGSQLAAIFASTDHLVRKHYPQTFDAVIGFAKQRYPRLNWDAKSKYPWKKLDECLRCVLHDLKLGNNTDTVDVAKGIAGHTDFATIVAAAFEDRLVLDDKNLWIVQDSGIWKLYNEKALHGLIRDFLHSKFAPTRFRLSNGEIRVEQVGACAKFMKAHGFLVSVTEEVKFLIRGAAPDFDRTRGWLPFRCGTLYDFAENKITQCSADMHLARNLPFDYQEFDVVHEAEWKTLTAEIIEHWRGGGVIWIPEAVVQRAFAISSLAGPTWLQGCAPSVPKWNSWQSS